MTRNFLYAVVGVLGIGVIALAYQLHEEQQKEAGVTIELKDNGISIDAKK